jgi:hypothetical protein
MSPLLVRKDQLRTPMRCPYSGARIILTKADPFGPAQWEACRSPYLLGECLRLLQGDLSSRKARQAVVAICRVCFGGCRNHWFREAVAAGEELVAAGITGRDCRQIAAFLDQAYRQDWDETWLAGLLCVVPAPVVDFGRIGSKHPNNASWAIKEVIPNPFRPPVVLPDWRTTTVLGLAEGVAADTAFDRLPILADALEDVGCTEFGLLAHLRGPGPHARGCWALDAVAGKV